MSDLLIHKQRRQTQYFSEVLVNEVNLEMIVVPGGEFLMGSPEDESGRSDNEGPQHRVSVEKFLLGRYPVTQHQWLTVAGYPRVTLDLDPSPSHFKGDHLPVESVSWQDAVEFCERLHAHTGRQYRLPTESEWEYACRSGTTTPFYFGRSISPKLANYNGRSSYGSGPKGEYRAQTTPVDHFGAANAFGLCDMHGNVWEWCQDNWHDSYDGAPSDGSAWLNENNNDFHVIRGGSWIAFPRNCRSACRHYLPDNYLGFRVAFSAPRTL